MSQTQQTKQRPQSGKKRRPVNRTATRKPFAHVEMANECLDEEYFQAMAALEWMALSEDDRNIFVGVGIHDREAFIDVRAGFKHKSPQDFLDWAQMVYVGHAKAEAELENYFDCAVQALSIAVRAEKYATGRDLLAIARSETRFRTILTTIRSKELPSGARYYWAPYEIGTSEWMMWLVTYSRKFERPWLGMPFDN